MTEMIEAVSIASLGHVDHDEESCAFCKSPQTPSDEENELSDNFDEDEGEVPGLEDEGIVHKNSAGKLGTGLRENNCPQLEDSVSLAGMSRDLPVKTAAHHIIPGNASLKVSDIMDHLHTDGMATGNIGYNVNNYENGTWLAGNYALRGKGGLPKWGPGGTAFTAKTGLEPKLYAFAAIDEMNRQFHDAHSDYSLFVKDALDLIADKMDETGDVWCPEAQEEPDDPEKRQLFMLVNRLNSISRRMQTMLEGPGRQWKKNVYTSRFSEQYIEEEIYGAG